MAAVIKPSSSLSVDVVRDVELGNPFLRMKIFSLIGVEEKALTLDDVPQEYRPYPGCLFVSVWGPGFSPGLFTAVLHHSMV